MGGNVGKDTKVSKEQALSAVADAFNSTPRNGTVTIEDIVRAAMTNAQYQPNRLDRWKTTSVDMNLWSQKPQHAIHTPRTGQKNSLMAGGRLTGMTAASLQDQQLKGLSTMTMPPSVTWKAALDAGTMTRDKRMSKIRMMFDALDVDNNHSVTELEFVQALAEEGIVEKEARSLFREMDESQTGRLTVAKFDHYAAVHTLSIVRDSFKCIDASRDRQIHRKEFAIYFMGNGLSKSQVSRLWADIDCNNNGKINFSECRDWARDALEMNSLHQVAMSLGMSSGE